MKQQVQEMRGQTIQYPVLQGAAQLHLSSLKTTSPPHLSLYTFAIKALCSKAARA